LSRRRKQGETLKRPWDRKRRGINVGENMNWGALAEKGSFKPGLGIPRFGGWWRDDKKRNGG